MANKSFSVKARESILAGVVGSHISDGAELLNAVDFIESPMGLGVDLYPVQRILVKLIFGVPIDYKEKMVPVYDVYGEELLQTLSERDYLKYAFDKGRLNIPDWRDADPSGYKEACVLVGRRGGKSQVVSAIAAYKLYLLLSIRSPQNYYGLVEGSPIDFTLMGQDELGASRLYDKLREDCGRSPFFATYLRTSTSQKMAFVSEADRNKRDATPTITAAAYACTTNAVRGPSSYMLALDEFAFYRSSSGTNSDAIYAAATPSTLQFKNPMTQRKDSMVMIISSPLKKVGKYYDVYKYGLENGPSCGTLSFRCSTAEMNPNTPMGSLRDEEKKSPLSFRYEYGGEFADSTESYVKSKQLDICVDPKRENVSHFSPDLVGHKYFWGFDLGMRNDASALSVGHWEYKEGRPCLIYDYVDRLMVGEGAYENEQELKLEHIIQWMDRVQKLLPCFRGVTDQHGGTMLVQLLRAYGIEGMDLMHLSANTNSKMYHCLKGLIDQGSARFPDHQLLIDEIKNLEADVINKYMIRVAAPEEKNSHDDMADSCALVALIAVEWAQGEGAREMSSLVASTGLSKQSLLGTPMFGSSPIDFVSLTDLRMLERQSNIRKTQMGIQSKQSLGPNQGMGSARRFR
jgi:hypothetical protein